MRLSLAALGAIYSIHLGRAQLEIQHTKTLATWFSSAYVTERFISSRTIQYGKTPVTPVPTLTVPTILTEPTASRNIIQTTWTTVTVTASGPTTEMSIIYATSPLPPPITTTNLTTAYIWTSPVLATITFTTTTACVSLSGAPRPNPRTTTKYTGIYTPFPGQITTAHLCTSFPTSVLAYYFNTITSRLYPFTGSTITQTITATATVYPSTTNFTMTIFSQGGRYTLTRYRTTLNQTKSDYQLAYVTHTPIPTPCRLGPTQATTTKTYHSKCAPENLVSEQQGRGVAVRLSPDEFTFPLGFPGVIIGIPGGGNSSTEYIILDPTACCQLCLDNKGCAASEWVIGGGLPGRDDGACRLFYYVGCGGDGTCGRDRGGGEMDVEYYGDSSELPGQGSLIQSGCGGLKYLGRMNPFCPGCENEGVDDPEGRGWRGREGDVRTKEFG